MLFLGTSLVPTRVLAASPVPGTVIENQATGSFLDPATSNRINIESNLVQVTVAEVAGITVTAAGVVEAPSAVAGAGPSQGNGTIDPTDVVYFDFVVTNVGNDPTQFFIPGTLDITNGSQQGAVQIIQVDYDGPSGAGAPTNFSSLPITIRPEGNNTGDATALGMPAGSIPAAGTLKVRVPVKINPGLSSGDEVTVQLGDPATSNPAVNQNQEYSDGGSNQDLYTVDNDEGDRIDDEAAGFPLNGDDSLHRQEASLLQSLLIGGSDYGDAPSLYGSPRHQIQAEPTLYLGTIPPDGEGGTQLGGDNGAGADGDDQSVTDDEDALTVLPDLPLSGTYTLQDIPVRNSTGVSATLHAWVDLDQDDKFAASEHQSVIVAPGATAATLSWTIPNIGSSGSTYARFRLTTDVLTDDGSTPDQDERSTLPASDGEVEDYAVALTAASTGADLSISKTHTAGPRAGGTFQSGDSVTYSITVTNNGPLDVLNAPFSDSVPTDLKNVSWNCSITIPGAGTDACDSPSGTGNSIRTTLDLSDGASATLFVTGILLPTPPSTITNTATIGDLSNNLAAPGVPDSDMSNNSASDSITVSSPAAGPPFVCDGQFVLAQNNPSDYYYVDTTQGQLVQIPSMAGKNPIAAYTNSIGFNVQDGYIYGYNPGTNTVYRVASDGTVSNLGVPFSGVNSVSGDVDAQGVYFLQTGNALYRINVTGLGTATSAGTVTLSRSVNLNDFAFNPLDGIIYGYDNANDVVVKIDPVSGSVINFTTTYSGTTAINQAGALYFDAFGNLYAYENASGKLIKYTLDLDTNTAVGTAFATNLGTVSLNDGSACPYGFSLEKTVASGAVNGDGTATASAGATVTYTYRISNQNTEPVNGISFTDVMPDTRVFMENSLTISPSLGGESNAYGNSAQLVIQGLTLPGNSISEITVEVRVPNNFLATEGLPAGSIVFNQAQLGNIPLGFNGPQINSDYPVTGARPDPTPLEITAPLVNQPEVALVKRITAVNGELTNPNDGTALNAYVDGAGEEDNHPFWPNADGDSNPDLYGAIEGGEVQPGQTVEYTIYFLSSGAEDAQNVVFCDRVPDNQTLVLDAYNGITAHPDGIIGENRAIVVSFDGSEYSYTNIGGDDGARYYPPGSGLPPACNLNINQNQHNGAIVVELERIPKATGAGIPANAHGFFRFRTTVNP